MTKADAIKSLEDVVAHVRAQHGLSPQRRSQICSAINTFAKVLNKAPADIVAEPAVVRKLRQQASWRLAGISKGRWTNVLSLLAAGMAEAGVKVHRSRRNFPLNDVWAALLARHPDKNGRRDLTRFAGWCCIQGKGPDQVTVELFDSFLEYLQSASIQRNPRERWHVARRAWNKGAGSVEAWPSVHVPTGEPDCWRARPWSSYPSNLAAEIGAYVAGITADDPFDDGHEAVEPVTARNYVQRLKVFASRLADDGEPIEHFSSLKSFVNPELVKRGLMLIIGDRSLEQAAPSASATITALLNVARYVGLEEAVREKLREYASKVRIVPVGMNERNKTRLAPLRDIAVKKRLLRLPLEIGRELAKVKVPTVRQAQRFQMAVLLEVLINAPMRIGNAAALDLDRHVNRPLPGTEGEWRISIPADEVKNGVALDFPLCPEAAALIEQYLSTFRPALATRPTTALFVSQSGVRKGPSALSKQFRQFIERELGLQIHAHLMRHFAGFAWLAAHPGEYETVRRLLGHKRIETTIRFYAGTETEESFRRYDAMIAEQRGLTDEWEVL